MIRIARGDADGEGVGEGELLSIGAGAVGAPPHEAARQETNAIAVRLTGGCP
jgi:hypothetical protein